MELLTVTSWTTSEKWLNKKDLDYSPPESNFFMTMLVPIPCVKPGIHLRQRQAQAWHGILGTSCRAADWRMFFSFCEVRHIPSILRIAGEFLGLASLWSNNMQWLGSRQPLRHVAWLGAPSTLAEERLPRHALACLCLKCIPDLKHATYWVNLAEMSHPTLCIGSISHPAPIISFQPSNKP